MPGTVEGPKGRPKTTIVALDGRGFVVTVAAKIMVPIRVQTGFGTNVLDVCILPAGTPGPRPCGCPVKPAEAAILLEPDMPRDISQGIGGSKIAAASSALILFPFFAPVGIFFVVIGVTSNALARFGVALRF